MEVSEAIKKRRSVRKFQKKEINSEIIDKLSDALVSAPSAGNLQSRQFYFVFNEEVRKKMSIAANRQQPLLEAPLAVVCCVDEERAAKYGERGQKLLAVCDVASAIENMMLLAVDLGLATLWMGAFDENQIKIILGLPDHLRPVAIVPVGYPDESPQPPNRLPKEQVITLIN
jgi:nitroreductase